jgi:neutral ceramidase
MKKIGIITGTLISIFLLLFFVFTTPVNHTPYLETDYFNNSLRQIDSLKNLSSHVNDKLSAGFSKVSITPNFNQAEENYKEGKFKQIPLAGYGGRKGAPATGVHDSIFVKAVALKVGKELIFLVSADLLIIPPNMVDSVTKILSEYGIRRSQLFFSATHTHSSLGAWGSGFVARQFAGEENPNLLKWLALKTAEAVTAAKKDLKPARIASGNFDAGQYTRNRLVGERGTKNNDFSFFLIEQPGFKKAVIGSFSAHATTLGDDNMEISADYPGYWARKMEKTAVDYALFFAGSMGSQSPASKGEDFEKAKYLGEALADSLNYHLEKTEPEEQVTFSQVSLEIPLPKFQIRLTTRRSLSELISKKLMPYTFGAWLQAFRIGNMVWVTSPADFSGEYAVQLKNALTVRGYNSNVTSFNGSYVGYIIPGKYFYLDEYEPKTMGWFGPYMGDYTVDLIRQLTEIVTTN